MLSACAKIEINDGPASTTIDINAAIARDKQIKGWVRMKKIALI